MYNKNEERWFRKVIKQKYIFTFCRLYRKTKILRYYLGNIGLH